MEEEKNLDVRIGDLMFFRYFELDEGKFELL